MAAAASLQFIYTLPPEMLSDYICTYKKNFKKKVSFVVSGVGARETTRLIVAWAEQKGGVDVDCLVIRTQRHPIVLFHTHRYFCLGCDEQQEIK